jgi:hypothetical protein
MRLNVARQFGHGTDRQSRKQRPLGPNEAHPRATLTADDVRAIRAACEAGVLLSELAQRYGVTETTISHIALRRTWLNVSHEPSEA